MDLTNVVVILSAWFDLTLSSLVVDVPLGNWPRFRKVDLELKVEYSGRRERLLIVLDDCLDMRSK